VTSLGAIHILALSLSDLPAVNASLNAIAGMLLILGWLLIRSGREQTHKIVMLTAFAMSVLFLASYLTYHFAPGGAGHVRFTGPSPVKEIYLGILLTHVVLAAAVPFLALRTIYLGLRDDRVRHKWWARLTLPVWLYVSVTGVFVYVMLYHLYPVEAAALIIK
jgi:uncharacterized membrane protein YozB (DUF420 family)